MLLEAKVEIHSVNLMCPHCGAVVLSPVSGMGVIDRGSLVFMEDELTCQGNARQPGCGRRFQLPEIVRAMRGTR